VHEKSNSGSGVGPRCGDAAAQINNLDARHQQAGDPSALAMEETDAFSNDLGGMALDQPHLDYSGLFEFQDLWNTMGSEFLIGDIGNQLIQS
jgi:hypothetical protein